MYQLRDDVMKFLSGWHLREFFMGKVKKCNQISCWTIMLNDDKKLIQLKGDFIFPQKNMKRLDVYLTASKRFSCLNASEHLMKYMYHPFTAKNRSKSQNIVPLLFLSHSRIIFKLRLKSSHTNIRIPLWDCSILCMQYLSPWGLQYYLVSRELTK